VTLGPGAVIHGCRIDAPVALSSNAHGSAAGTEVDGLPAAAVGLLSAPPGAPNWALPRENLRPLADPINGRRMMRVDYVRRRRG
jgi:hypothetical protein